MQFAWTLADKNVESFAWNLAEKNIESFACYSCTLSLLSSSDFCLCRTFSFYIFLLCLVTSFMFWFLPLQYAQPFSSSFLCFLFCSASHNHEINGFTICRSLCVDSHDGGDQAGWCALPVQDGRSGGAVCVRRLHRDQLLGPAGHHHPDLSGAAPHGWRQAPGGQALRQDWAHRIPWTGQFDIMIIIVIISVVPCLIDTGDYAALWKLNESV